MVRSLSSAVNLAPKTPNSLASRLKESPRRVFTGMSTASGDSAFSWPQSRLAANIMVTIVIFKRMK